MLISLTQWILFLSRKTIYFPIYIWNNICHNKITTYKKGILLDLIWKSTQLKAWVGRVYLDQTNFLKKYEITLFKKKTDFFTKTTLFVFVPFNYMRKK